MDLNLECRSHQVLVINIKLILLNHKKVLHTQSKPTFYPNILQKSLE